MINPSNWSSDQTVRVATRSGFSDSANFLRISKISQDNLYVKYVNICSSSKLYNGKWFIINHLKIFLIDNNIYIHKHSPRKRIMSVIFVIWPNFLVTWFSPSYATKGLGKSLVIFSVGTGLWSWVAITYMLRAHIFHHRVGFSSAWI